MHSFLRGEQHLLSVLFWSTFVCIRLKIEQGFENFPVSSCFSHRLVQEMYKHAQKALHCEIVLFQWCCVPLMGVEVIQTASKWSSFCLWSGLLGFWNVFRLHCLHFREDQVNFRGFMRTLAHFRPIEDNEKNKNAASSEPLNSRTNKLLCECGTSVLYIHRTSAWVCVDNLYIYSQSPSVCMTWTEMTKSLVMNCCRWVDSCHLRLEAT